MTGEFEFETHFNNVWDKVISRYNTYPDALLAGRVSLSQILRKTKNKRSAQSKIPKTYKSRLGKDYIWIGKENKRHSLELSIWSNPFSHNKNTPEEFKTQNAAESAQKYKEWLIEHPTLLAKINDLRNKNLLCSCTQNQVCHGIVLMHLANKGVPNKKHKEDGRSGFERQTTHLINSLLNGTMYISNLSTLSTTEISDGSETYVVTIKKTSSLSSSPHIRSY